MCILFFILNENAKDGEYKLILAANRDEYYDRPAQVAGRWKEDESIIGGRDMKPGREGGTWLAISTRNHIFKFGALLNVPGEAVEHDASPRGNIVNEYVSNTISNVEHCHTFINSEKKFDSFNFITIEISKKDARAIHYSNVGNNLSTWPQNEVLGFGNSPSHTPLRKVNSGKNKFQQIIDRHNQSKYELIQSLCTDLLKNREKHWPDDELYRRRGEMAEPLSSICVKITDKNYGTRTRTIILIDAYNNVDFYEETMISNNPDDDWKRTHIESKF